MESQNYTAVLFNPPLALSEILRCFRVILFQRLDWRERTNAREHRYCARNRSTVNEWGVKFR